MKSMLTLVGLGLGHPKGLTLETEEAIMEADSLFLETYTSPVPEPTIDAIQKRTGKRFTLLDRKAVEESNTIFEAAKTGKAVVAVGGDPLMATTHQELLIRARDMGIETRVVHAPSIISAVAGAAGLQHYKFARIVSLPWPKPNFFPTSPYDNIKANLERGDHTLLLLDTEEVDGRMMTANDAIDILEGMEEQKGNGIIDPDQLVVVLARVGHDDQLVVSGPIKTLKGKDFGPPLHCLIIPGKLHFMEEEAMDKLTEH